VKLSETVRACAGMACGEAAALGARSLGLGPIGEDLARASGQLAAQAGFDWVASRVGHKVLDAETQDTQQTVQPSMQAQGKAGESLDSTEGVAQQSAENDRITSSTPEAPTAAAQEEEEEEDEGLSPGFGT
jgi:hypothetical protein